MTDTVMRSEGREEEAGGKDASAEGLKVVRCSGLQGEGGKLGKVARGARASADVSSRFTDTAQALQAIRVAFLLGSCFSVPTWLARGWLCFYRQNLPKSPKSPSMARRSQLSQFTARTATYSTSHGPSRAHWYCTWANGAKTRAILSAGSLAGHEIIVVIRSPAR